MAVPLHVVDYIYKLHKTGDHLILYEISDNSDETANPIYYGYLNAEGGWIIMEWNTVNRTYRYCAGSNPAYKTAATGAWATRAGLVYVYFNEI